MMVDIYIAVIVTVLGIRQNVFNITYIVNKQIRKLYVNRLKKLNKKDYLTGSVVPTNHLEWYYIKSIKVD